MLSRPVRSEAQPRAKNGPPAQSTTGVDSASWIQPESRGAIGLWPIRWPPISSMKTGRARAMPIQNRLLMSASSRFGPASAVRVSGSSAMPQIGQDPGPI